MYRVMSGSWAPPGSPVRGTRERRGRRTVAEHLAGGGDVQRTLDGQVADGVTGQAGRAGPPEQPGGRLGDGGDGLGEPERQIARLRGDAPLPQDRAQRVVQDDRLGVGDVEDTAGAAPYGLGR